MKKYLNKDNIVIILISAFVIVLFHNLKLHWYVKDVIVPCTVMFVSYIVMLRKIKHFGSHVYYFFLPVILILVSNFIVPIDESNMVLNMVILPIMLFFFFLSWVNPHFSLSKNWLKLGEEIFPNHLIHNLTFLKKDSSVKDNKTSNIFLGIFCGSIIGLVILSLLTSADAYFDAFISQLFYDIDVSNIVLLVISFVILFSVYVNIILNKDTKLEDRKIRELDHTIISTVLIMVNSIFVLFLLSEISKLTTNFLQLPIEYTYASYAREGFFQLLFVTLINFSMILFLLYKSNIMKESSIVKFSSLLLIGFSVLLIFNSYYRMFLYIGHYGFTVLRMQVILFLLMEFILFLLLVKKIVKGLKYQDSYLYFIVMICFYILNLYICNVTFIKFFNL